jgi:hypothetical protein
MSLDVRLIVLHCRNFRSCAGRSCAGWACTCWPGAKWAVSLDLVLWANLVRHSVLLLSGAQRAVLINKTVHVG